MNLGLGIDIFTLLELCIIFALINEFGVGNRHIYTTWVVDPNRQNYTTCLTPVSSVQSKCESIWYLCAFQCESLYAVYMGTAAIMETLYSSYRSVYSRIIDVNSVLRLFPTSNAIVERCFSTMLQVKTDWGNKLGAKSLEHLLWIKCAAPECVSNEFQRLQATKQQALWAKDKESESRSAGFWRCGSCGCRLISILARCCCCCCSWRVEWDNEILIAASVIALSKRCENGSWVGKWRFPRRNQLYGDACIR